MSTYIRKEDAIDVLHVLQNKMSGCGVRALESAIGAIEDLVEADVAQIKHGCWALRENNNHVEPDGVCSNCGAAWVFSDIHYFSYCPHCGTRMDGVRHDA